MDDQTGAIDAPTTDIAPKTPAPEVGTLVPQRHGGSLRHGSTPGGPAGSNTPAHVRYRARSIFEKNLEAIQKIIDNPHASDSDRLKALDLAGKYGLGAAHGVQLDQVRDRLKQTLVILERMLPVEFADAVMGAIEAVWQ